MVLAALIGLVALLVVVLVIVGVVKGIDSQHSQTPAEGNTIGSVNISWGNISPARVFHLAVVQRRRASGFRSPVTIPLEVFVLARPASTPPTNQV